MYGLANVTFCINSITTIIRLMISIPEIRKYHLRFFDKTFKLVRVSGKGLTLRIHDEQITITDRRFIRLIIRQLRSCDCFEIDFSFIHLRLSQPIKLANRQIRTLSIHDRQWTSGYS